MAPKASRIAYTGLSGRDEGPAKYSLVRLPSPFLHQHQQSVRTMQANQPASLSRRKRHRDLEEINQLTPQTEIKSRFSLQSIPLRAHNLSHGKRLTAGTFLPSLRRQQERLNHAVYLLRTYRIGTSLFATLRAKRTYDDCPRNSTKFSRFFMAYVRFFVPFLLPLSQGIGRKYASSAKRERIGEGKGGVLYCRARAR
jgi:hypothetical protein